MQSKDTPQANLEPVSGTAPRKAWTPPQLRVVSISRFTQAGGSFVTEGAFTS